MDCTINVAKTKALISFADTGKLVCTFVFAYADCCFFMQRLIFLIFHMLKAWFRCYFEFEKEFSYKLLELKL